jgi:hypothetical protein
MNGGLILGRKKRFFFSTAFRLALGSTQLLIHLEPGALSTGIKWQGVKLTT